MAVRRVTPTHPGEVTGLDVAQAVHGAGVPADPKVGGLMVLAAGAALKPPSRAHPPRRALIGVLPAQNGEAWGRLAAVGVSSWPGAAPCWEVLSDGPSVSGVVFAANAWVDGLLALGYRRAPGTGEWPLRPAAVLQAARAAAAGAPRPG